jgi:conjugative relaxase-like TrwC/TraI family protein
MLSIGKLSSGSAAADYFLRRQAGCAADYYTGDGERAGVWCGHGAQQLGLSGELDAAGEQSLRALLAGRSPDGEELVGPVWRADPRGRVRTAEVITAVRAAASERGVDPAVLLGDPTLVEVFGTAQAALTRSRHRVTWPAVSMPADVAGALLAAAGADPAVVLRGPRGRDRFGAALRRMGSRVDVRLPGLDFCLSAPKSVSLLYAFGDVRTSALVRTAHQTAVNAAVDHLERACATGQRGHHGGTTERRVDTDGLIGVGFEHRTSRASDPQLHTHVVVANLLHGVDGKWGALDTREAYAQARTGGFIYQAVLRGELTRTLGVGWSAVRKGQAEIDGAPRALLRLFSKRRVAIDAELDRVGHSSPPAAQRAALVTRPGKTFADPVLLRARWEREAIAAGFDPVTVTDWLHRVDPPALTGAAEVAARLLAPGGLTVKRSTFDRRDVLQGVCTAIPAGAPVTGDELRALATALVRDPAVVPLLPDVSVRCRRYSTRELLIVEIDTEQRATARADDDLAVADLAVVNRLIAGADLSSEQAAMVRQVTTSGAGVEVVVGPAGSGKTRALAVARAAWDATGVAVQGAALAAIAARVLQDGAGIPARSLSRLLTEIDRADPRRPPRLPAGGVLVVDEAGMVGTRQLAGLVALTQHYQTKLVLVGDPHQLPEIEAGGLFAALANALPAASLVGNQRQRARWERVALAELRDGDVPAAVRAYRRQGRLKIADDPAEQRERIITDYRAAREQHGPGQVLVVTSSRADARRLNAVVRDALLTDGRLGDRELRVPVGGSERSYRVGDEVMVTANDYSRALLNGTRGVITGLHSRAGAVTVRLGDGRDIRLPSSYLSAGRLTHGYALTAHKAQGLTVEVALLWGSAALTRETGYVAMSRGRSANYLYATWDGLRQDTGEDDHPRVGLRPSAADSRLLTGAALTQRLESSAGQRLARSWLRRRDSSTLDPQPAARALGHGLERDIS